MNKPVKTKTRSAVGLQAVAEQAGVSRETVSHILGLRASLYNKKTVERVRKAAAELGYRPHRGAQTLRTGRSRLIAAVHFGMHYVVSQTAQTLPAELRRLGYELLVLDLSWEEDDHRRILDKLIAARVEGVIVIQMAGALGQDAIQGLLDAGIPVVSLAGFDRLKVPIVRADARAAFCQLTRHLLSLGHRRLLLMGTHVNASTTRERYDGFRDALVEAGAPEPAEFVAVPALTDRYEEDALLPVSGQVLRVKERQWFDIGLDAYGATCELIEAGKLPDAILCPNCSWAKYVISALREHGLSVPEDVAVTGFNNEPIGAHPRYSLTTMEQPRAEQSRKVADLIHDLIEGKPVKQQIFLFPCKMVVRTSCGVQAPRKEELVL